MPFTARCVRCGYVVMANKRKMLDDFMENHDSKSHKSTDSRDFDFCTWSIAVVSDEDYGMLLNASKVSAFWNALNTRVK